MDNNAIQRAIATLEKEQDQERVRHAKALANITAALNPLKALVGGTTPKTTPAPAAAAGDGTEATPATTGEGKGRKVWTEEMKQAQREKQQAIWAKRNAEKAAAQAQAQAIQEATPEVTVTEAVEQDPNVAEAVLS